MNTTGTEPIPNQLLEQPGFTVEPALEAQVSELLTHYPTKRSAALMVLHLFQERFGHISRQAVEWIAAKLDLQPINIYELATFYPMFQRNPVGKLHFRICRTLSCALGGSHQLHDYFCRKLGLDPQIHGPQTTPDGKVTVEFVECLANCGKAPVMMCNDAFYENVTEKTAGDLLARTRGA